MSNAQHTPEIKLTAPRLSWLKALNNSGDWIGWNWLPRRNGTMNYNVPALTNRTWVPMVTAGLIERRFHLGENEFRITDAGRAAIAKATGE